MSGGIDPAPAGRAERLAWLDAARVIATCGVVALHTSVNRDGEPFPGATPAARLFPVVVRTVAEVASPEFFVLMSLFLLACGLDRHERGYAATTRRQVRRLAMPFLAWTVLYAAWRGAAAAWFGLDPGFLAALASPAGWASFLLLGTVQFHMYFLPTLLATSLLYPCYRVALKEPWTAALLLPLLYLREQLDIWLWSFVQQPDLRDGLLQLVRVVTYAGYGLAAFWLFGRWRRGLAAAEGRDLRLLACLCLTAGLAAEFAYAAQTVRDGTFPKQEGLFFYARFLLPVLLLAWFVGAQHLTWPAVFGRLAPYTYGIFLIHPMPMDIFEILAEPLCAWPALYVSAKFAFTLATSVALVRVIARSNGLAWTIGLGGVTATSSGPRRPVASANLDKSSFDRQP